MKKRPTYQFSRLIGRTLWNLKINYSIESDLSESQDQTQKLEKSVSFIMIARVSFVKL